MFPSLISKCLCSSANLAISYKTRKNIFFNKTLTSYFYLKQSKTPNNSICRRPSYQLSKLDYRRVYYNQVRLNLLVSCNAAIKSKSFLELIIFYSEARTFIIPILTWNQVFLGNFFSPFLQVLILVGSRALFRLFLFYQCRFCCAHCILCVLRRPAEMDCSKTSRYLIPRLSFKLPFQKKAKKTLITIRTKQQEMITVTKWHFRSMRLHF